MKTPLTLVLTSVYRQERGIKALLRAHREEPDRPVRIWFFVDEAWVDYLLSRILDQGWLGRGSLDTVRQELERGYMHMARDVLIQLQERPEIQQLQPEMEVREGRLSEVLLSEAEGRWIVSGERGYLERFSPALAFVEWVVEEPGT